MKKLLSILAVSFLMIGMIACDVIDEQDYIKNNGGTTPPETPIEPGDPGETGEFTTTKCVLIEDYTGVRCNNCPAAGEIAIDLQKQYGHSVVVLGVQAGSTATPIWPGDATYYYMNTTEGEEWYNTFGFIDNPIGTVNRKLNSGTYGFYPPDWADAVATTLQEECTVAMASNVEYDETSRNLKVDITSKALVELPETYRLTVCVMEDSIIARQQTPEGVIEDYVHRHVFRKTMNGTWGDEINEAPLAPEEEVKKSYSIKLDDAYNANQCYVVAYVHNDATREVLQVIEKKIK